MDDKNQKFEEGRNRPADEGRNNDPNIRDESAHQPGVSTMSSSDSDDRNQRVTRTAADNFLDEADDDADPRFDEIGDDEPRK